MMKTKLTLFVAVLAVGLILVAGCGDSTEQPSSLKPKKSKNDFTNGLVAYYPFNGNANDESGNDNNGTVYGAALTTDRAGSAGKAYNFVKANTTERIKIPGQTLNGATAFTWTAWVNLNSAAVGKWDNFISGVPDAANHNEFIIGTWDGKFKIYHKGVHIKGFSVMSWPSQWKHVTVTRSSATAPFKVYVDGVFMQDFTFGTSGSPNIHADGLVLGNEQDSVGGGFHITDALGGKMDEVRIYDRALSETEVKALYDLEKPKKK